MTIRENIFDHPTRVQISRNTRKCHKFEFNLTGFTDTLTDIKYVFKIFYSDSCFKIFSFKVVLVFSLEVVF